MAVLPMLSIVFMGLTFFTAIKQEKYGSIIGLSRQVIFYIPVMLLLPHFFGVEWVYYGSTIIDILITAWVLLIVARLFKMLSQTKENTTIETEKV